MNSHEVLDRGSLSVISNALPRLRGAPEKVAQYVLSAPRETINSTISALASRIGVSEASIVRFSQTLGYPGFHALKIRLAEDLVAPKSFLHEDLAPDDEPAVAAKKAMAMGLRSLEDTIHLLDLEVLGAVIAACCAAHNIYLFASGNSTPIAMDLVFRLTKIGLHCRSSVDPTMQEMHASLTTSDDVAVGISYTGSSRDTVHVLDLARQCGARTVCITNHSDSPLAREADFCLYSASRVGFVREERLSSHLAMLSLTEALFVGICTARSDATERAVSRTLRATAHRKY
jgi:RpiR family transcriptional regulator, carbohydrate utilization regulator